MTSWLPPSGDSAGLPETLALLARLREAVRNLGCDIKPASRLGGFERRLRRFEDPTYRPYRDPAYDPGPMLHGARDLRELAFICEKLTPLHSDKLRLALPTLLRGPAVPGDRPNGERPRNLQFEYFFAAQLIHSGFDVRLDEPDMIFVHDADSIPLAAKRVTSAGQVIPRLKEGLKQLKRVGGRGLVALSLDRLLPGPYVGAGSEHALDDATRTLTRGVIKPYATAAQDAMRKSEQFGLAVSVCVVGFIRVPWHPAFASASLFLPRDDDASAETETVRRIVAAMRSPSE